MEKKPRLLHHSLSSGSLAPAFGAKGAALDAAPGAAPVRRPAPIATILARTADPAGALARLNRLGAARDVEALWALLAETLGLFGFDCVSYGLTRMNGRGSLGDPRDLLFLTNASPERLARGYTSEFLMRTPMFRWVRNNVGACSWRWAEEEYAAGRLLPDEIAAMQHSRSLGILAGYSISFAAPQSRTRGAIALTGRPGLTQDDVEVIWTRRSTEITALCTTAHLRLCQLPLQGARRPLSPRQREALEWVAEGKTTQDIAMIMGISAAMVEKHLRLARQVLDVETTAHAVAKAAQLNQIFNRPD